MDDKPTFPVHGPGPPVQLLPSSDADAEIKQLKNELQMCLGKIKGYETLGHLFQESKLECARYKQKNEELAKRLDSLTRRLSPSEPLYEPAGAACLKVPSAPVFHSNDDHSSESILERDAVGFNIGSSRQRLVALPVECNQQTCLNLKEVGATTPPTRAGEKYPGASSASTPSFVQINSSDAGWPVYSLSNVHDSSAQKEPEQSNVLTGVSIARNSGDDLSFEVNQLAEQLKTAGHDGGASPQELAADLIRAGVNVIRLQKQTRVQQVLLDQQTAQIAELRADIVTKQQTIQILQKDCDTLRNTVKGIEIAREQALEDARIKYSEIAKEQDDPAGGSNSAEWVEVEHHQSFGVLEGGADKCETIITAVPVVEVELRRRIEKLNATVSELVSVNRSWDEHCRHLELSHVQQMAALQTKVDNAERRLVEYEQADLKRQADFDSLLLNAKKQREAEETAKEEALTQLHLERQQRIDYEQKCIEFSRKTAELESRLMQPYFRLAELAQNHQSSPQVGDLNQQVVETSSTREEELRTHLFILQEQLRVFKEDFDQERRDREHAKTKVEALQKHLKEQTDQNTIIRRQLTQTTAELNAAKGDRELWRQRYQKLSDDLQALQRQARPSAIRTSSASFPRDVPRTPVQTAFAPNYFVRTPSWFCSFCTFKNEGRRTSCEMCGRKKIRESSQLNDDTMVDGRPVAGLQSFQSAMPYTSLVSRSLVTDKPDDRQYNGPAA